MKTIILLGTDIQKSEFLAQLGPLSDFEEEIVVLSFNHVSKFPLFDLEKADAVICFEKVNNSYERICETLMLVPKDVPIDFYMRENDGTPFEFLKTIISGLQQQKKTSEKTAVPDYPKAKTGSCYDGLMTLFCRPAFNEELTNYADILTQKRLTSFHN